MTIDFEKKKTVERTVFVLKDAITKIRNSQHGLNRRRVMEGETCDLEERSVGKFQSEE